MLEMFRDALKFALCSLLGKKDFPMPVLSQTMKLLIYFVPVETVPVSLKCLLSGQIVVYMDSGVQNVII